MNDQPRRGRPPLKARSAEEIAERIDETIKPAEPAETPKSLTFAQEQARAAQRQMLDSIRRQSESPEGVSMELFVKKPPDLEAQEIYVPEAIDRITTDANGRRVTVPGTMSTYTAPPEDEVKVARQGWEPVYDAFGKNVLVGNDYLFKRPREISDAHFRSVTAQSRQKMKAADNSMTDADEEGVVGQSFKALDQETEVSKVSL